MFVIHYWLQNYITIDLLAKISNLSEPILGSYGQETPQNQPKIVFSAFIEIFEITKPLLHSKYKFFFIYFFLSKNLDKF